MNRRVAKVVAPKKIEVFEEPIPALKDDEILMRVLATGLCHTDIPAYSGMSMVALKPDGSTFMQDKIQFPIYVGHEPTGIVEDVGKGIKHLKPGDKVGGLARQSFASHLVANTAKLAKIPDEVTESKYCLPEPLMCISNIVRTANPGLGDCVAVIGCGMMGLLTIAGLAKSAAREVIAVDLLDSRLEWAKKMGATTIINPKKESVVDKVKSLTDGRGVEIAVEITGRLAGLTVACDIIKECRGDILLPSLYAGNQTLEAACGYQLMFKSPRLHSTHPWYSENYGEDIRRGIWAYMSGVLPLRKLITHEFKLDDIQHAFNVLESGQDGYIKGIVVP